MTANRYIGSPIERLEDLRFLRGRGEYVDDLERPGMLHAAILRSPLAHGLVRRLDITAALALPGVHRVVTAADMGEGVPKIPIRLQPMKELEPYHQPVLAEGRVRYVGEPIALVLADTPAQAEDAVEAIVLDIAPLPSDGLLFPETGSNLAILYTAAKGGAADAFAGAPYMRRESFAVQRHTALSLEPRGLMAEWDAGAGRLTVYGASKVAFFNRRILAAQLGLPIEAIDMVENDVGGGFGMRGEFYPEDFLVPFAARLVGRPVKWIEDRREHLISANHAREARADLEIACTREGRILALRGRIEVDIGAYTRTNGMVGARNVAQFLSGPYRIPDIHVESALRLSNKTPVGTYRGPGRFEADFFRERLLDLAATDLRLDPIEFRRDNLVAAHEMPYPLATITPFEKRDELDSGDYRMTFDRCLAEIGWEEKAELQGKRVGGRFHGVAIGPFVEGGAAGPAESARIALEADGRVAVYVGSSAVGQGLETAFAQIAADALELPMERISGVFHGSTSHVAEGFGSFHSRAVVMGGSAILLAAERLLAAIRNAGAERLGCAPDAIEITDDAVLAPGKLLALGELAPLDAEARFDNDKHTYTYGAHAAHVAVDPTTGHVAVLDYVAVEDVGRIINPLTLRGQVIGGVVQGLGGAFLEELVYDAQGQLLSGSLADYLLPSASDFPRIRAVLLEHARAPNNPLGAKGAGEGGVVPVAGVIANAVAAALQSLGVEPNELPLSPPRLWALIEAARQSASA